MTTTAAATIGFTCGSCGRPFTVPGSYAGRRARCKSCGSELTVPAAPAARAVKKTVGSAPEGSIGQTPTARLSPRARRLLADAEQMKRVFDGFGTIRVVDMAGDPPDTYRLKYRVKGLAPGEKPDQPVECELHEVEIKLPAEYPRSKPLCRVLTPVFHPNIDTATICVGDHWTAGERLADLVLRIGEMLAYQAYNIKSPLDAHAAMWADLNGGKLPTDARNLRPPGL
jgi:ubiquitin-protein ligase